MKEKSDLIEQLSVYVVWRRRILCYIFLRKKVCNEKYIGYIKRSDIVDEDKQKCIDEAKRVCKDGGKIFFAFISNDFVFLTEFGYDINYFSNGDYDKDTFKLNDFPFVFHTVEAARNLLQKCDIDILHEVASDGASELLATRINEMSEEDYAQYLRYHFYICEKPEMIGMSNHLLFVGEER